MKKGDWYFIDEDRVLLITEMLDNNVVNTINFRKNFIYESKTKKEFVEELFTKAHSVDIKNNRYSFFDENNHYIGEVEI